MSEAPRGPDTAEVHAGLCFALRTTRRVFTYQRAATLPDKAGN